MIYHRRLQCLLWEKEPYHALGGCQALECDRLGIAGRHCEQFQGELLG